MVAVGDTLIGPVITQTIVVEFKTKQHSIGVVLVNGMIIVRQHHTLSSADLELQLLMLTVVDIMHLFVVTVPMEEDGAVENVAG